MSETRKMDFVLAGCPRSGTTAAAAYLRAVDSVYCAHEAFRMEEDHSTLDMPRDLIAALREKTGDLIEKREKNRVRRAYHGSYIDLEERVDQIRFYGNKTPHYIYRLDEISQEIAQPRAIVSVREIEPVAISYVRRAEDEKDRWKPGRTATYAVGDLLVLLHVLGAMGGDDALILPSRLLRDDWAGSLDAMVNFISPGLSYTVSDDAIAALDDYKSERKRVLSDRTETLPASEQEMVDLVKSAGFEDLFMRDRPFPLSEIKADLDALLARLPDPLDYVEQSLKTHANPETTAFFRPWRRHAMAAMKRTTRARKQAERQQAQ